MRVYENVIIGNFLYGLGHSIGRRATKKQTLAIVNLLQQTPADKELGDVMLEFPGVVRLIEFKNKKSSLTKEKRRNNKLKKVIGRDFLLEKISREIHWYVETEPFEEVCINNIKPYLDAFDGSSSCYTLDSFIESISEEVTSPATALDDVLVGHYISLVSKCQGSGSVGTGGLLISASSEGIHYVQLEDIMQLNMKHKQFVNCYVLELKSIMRKREQDLGGGLEMKRVLGRSS